MWSPQYQIHSRLLTTIRQIGETLGAIQAAQLSAPALSKLVIEARSLSTFASTSIEGNPLPLTDVKRLLKNAPVQVRDTEREILNYNRALEWVEAQVAANTFEVSVRTFETIQGMVIEGLMDNPADIGQMRQRPVLIRDPQRPDAVVFIPPDVKEVPDLCEQLMAFLNAHLNELDPILLAGLFHKQAVLIHPFMDGNGRSTRLMTTGILGLTGFDFFSIFSFEAYYNRNVTRYFQQVGEQGDYYDLKDEIEFTNWLEYFADGILDELKRVQKSLPTSDIQYRLEPHHTLVLDYIERHGSITQRDYGEISGRSLSSRKVDFAKMVDWGLITPVGAGRSVYYILSK